MRTALTWLIRAGLVLLGAIIAYVFAYNGMVYGVDRIIAAESITPGSDSEFRFISILTIGLSLTLVWLAINFNHTPILLHIATLTVFAGGLGRLYSWQTIGAPPDWMKFAMGIEFGLPAFILAAYYLRSLTKSKL